MEYKIINYWFPTGAGVDAEEKVIKDTEKLVNEAIKEGWRPQGGIAVTVTSSVCFTQAMVRN